MGVRHAREYNDILKDLTAAVGQIQDCFRFFEMEVSEWEALSEDEKHEVLEALADDVFYGLGEESIIEVGSGSIRYNSQHHVIEVEQGDQVSQIIRLI
ncbi:hypothetical protein [Paenibacillus endoradicis]|uniref:hypothetical protein n=1 Tax=Paenibacillus endoradicis TaxID=2972487 RepID=UPI0021594711|nr:hypothetical protein [Paenibacillus endoradicis]MCR8660434.1 hypothetical protein [Paenibacillus endoradicis]